MTIPKFKMKHGILCYLFGLITDFVKWPCNSSYVMIAILAPKEISLKIKTGWQGATYQSVPNYITDVL
jgi:hypothetical protein